ncbi:MAG: sugar ABC transporter permease [Actinobacteria bacterium]|nr:sugar ABC transporter permease [Actinomycetota bacterium]
MPLSRRWAPYLFLAPNLTIFLLFTILPALNGFNISFYDSRNGRTFRWVGLGNYERLLSEEAFWSTAQRTLLFVSAFVVLVVLISIPLAVLLNAQRRGRGFFRGAYFLPVLIAPVVVGLIWYWALDRQVGLVNTVLDGLGLGKPGWLIEPSLAMACAIFVGLWTHIGFYTVILLAGLQGIDPNLYEAARMDGASRLQEFRRITLPLLQPTTLVVVILSTITGFQAFDFIYTLTGGGPVGGTTLIVQFIYERAFTSPIRYGLASAAGVMLFVVVFGVTVLNYLVGRRREAV